MKKIAIVSGTDRPNSNAKKVSNYLQRKFSEAGAEAIIIDLADFPLADVAGGKYGKAIPASVKTYNEDFLSADGVLMVVPEYNGSFPGILKLFIDYLPFPDAFLGLPMAFVGESAGSFGALRPVEQLQMVASYRNAYQFPERVFINRVHENFDEINGPIDELQNQLLNKLVVNFIQFVEKLK